MVNSYKLCFILISLRLKIVWPYWTRPAHFELTKPGRDMLVQPATYPNWSPDFTLTRASISNSLCVALELELWNSNRWVANTGIRWPEIDHSRDLHLLRHILLELYLISSHQVRDSDEIIRSDHWKRFFSFQIINILGQYICDVAILHSLR